MLKKLKNIIISDYLVFFRFAVSGLFFNLIGFFFYIILSNYFHPIFSLLVSYPIIILFYFLIQNFYVFKKKQLDYKKITKFFLNSIFLLILNTFLLFAAVEILYFDYKVSQFIIMIFLNIINFVIQKKIFFT